MFNTTTESIETMTSSDELNSSDNQLKHFRKKLNELTLIVLCSYRMSPFDVETGKKLILHRNVKSQTEAVCLL